MSTNYHYSLLTEHIHSYSVYPATKYYILPGIFGVITFLIQFFSFSPLHYDSVNYNNTVHITFCPPCGPFNQFSSFRVNEMSGVLWSRHFVITIMATIMATIVSPWDGKLLLIGISLFKYTIVME